MNSWFQTLRLKATSRLRYRIQLSFAALILLAVIPLACLPGLLASREMLDYSRRSLRVNLTEVVKTLDYYYGTYLAKTDVIFVDRDLEELVSGLDGEPTIAEQSRINEILGRMTLELRYPEVQSTYYFGGVPTYYLYMPLLRGGTYMSNLFSYDDIRETVWFRELQEEKRMFSWQGLMQADGISYVGFQRRLIDHRSLEENAILQTLIPVEKIRNVINQNLYMDVDSYLYLDAEGKRITGYGNPRTMEYLQDYPPDDDGIHEQRINGTDVIVCAVESELNGWKLVYVLPKDVVYAQIRFILPTTVLVGLVALLVAFPVSSGLSMLISRRVKLLTEKANSIAGGDFSVRAEISGNDEIARLAQDFNTMMEEILRLTHRQYVSQIQINEIKAELLQEQLNPHLLYNSLAMARMVARRNGQAEIYELLNDMINYYKSVLNRGHIIASVRTEINMIRHYLSIVRSVYQLELTTTFEIAEDIEDLYLVKLFMQPIVENAVMHGVRQMSGGRISIAGRRRGSQLFFSVTDDGAGFEPGVLAELQRCLREETTSGITGYGLLNVQKRLRLLFPTCEFTIESTPGEGTCVSMLLPAMTAEDIRRQLEERHLEI